MNPEEQKNNSKISLPEISVIIPFCGNKIDLFRCMDNIQRQRFTKSFEVIVVESGNDPEIRKFMSIIPNSVLFSSDSLMYPGKARNIAVKNARTNFLAFIDADCVPAAEWLNEIFSSLNNGCKIAVGPTVNLYPFHSVASVDNILQFVDFQKFRTSDNITHFPACNFGITKNLFEKAGGFPENYITGEDILFSQAAIRNCNGKILFNKRMVVKHCGRKSIHGFLKHNETLGYYRGLLNLKVPDKYMKYRKYTLYPLLYGFRRLGYISLRTVQWNPIGILRIIFYFPLIVAGLSAWVIGFRRGNKKNLKEGISDQLTTEAFLK